MIKSCEIRASNDASIKNAIANDIPNIISNSAIRAIFLHGKTAQQLFEKFFHDVDFVNLIGKKPIIFNLPSTSPANAKYDISQLLHEWSIIKNQILN